MLDEIDGGDLCTQIDLFDHKLNSIKDKAKSLLVKVKNFESHHDRLPDILTKFRDITELFESGYYKKMIVGELERNYMEINDMAEKLGLERQEDSILKEKLALLDDESNEELDLNDFEYICQIIDDRRALIQKYDK
jgi:predicted nuclease with TOPRIM domain